MFQNYEISDQTRQQLLRPMGGQVRFSDVFPEVIGIDEEAWWQGTDFDGALTDGVLSAGFEGVKQVPIGFRPWLAEYGLVLTDDLVRSRSERAARLKQETIAATTVHPDIKKTLQASSRAIIGLANYAPRDDVNIANGQNGSDFYLAITDSGLEVYATPLRFLSGLEARNRITSLYRIPNQGHPEFNGDHEQFRSARVIHSRLHPGHLKPVFEYASQEEVVAAKTVGTHPDIIPTDQRTGRIAFVDKFGNIKLELQDAEAVRALRLGSPATLSITDHEETYELPIEVAESMRSAPLEQFVVYTNCSDHQDKGSRVGFVELVSRVNGDPNRSPNTAIFQLLKQIPDLDPATAEVAVKPVKT